MDYYEPEHNIHRRFSGSGPFTETHHVTNEFTSGFSDEDNHFKSFRKFNLEHDNMIPVFNEIKSLKSKLHEAEARAIELEREWVTKQMNSVKTEPLCTICNLDECKPAQRRMVELMKFHQQLLDHKPGGHLCIKGIFGWISESLLDTKEGTTHHDHSKHCHQVTDTSVMRSQLLAKAANFLQIRRALFGTECTLEKPCVTCLDFVLTEINKFLHEKYECPRSTSRAFSVSPSPPEDMSRLEKQWNEKFIVQENQIHFLKECVENEKIKGDEQVLSKMNETVESLLASEKELKSEVETLFKMNCQLKNMKDNHNGSPKKHTMKKLLTPFSGFVWESPEHAIDKWQQELKSNEVSEIDWIPTVVDQGLHGAAHAWWLANEDNIMGDTSLNYWDVFSEKFRHYFESKKYYEHHFLPQCRSLLSHDDFGDDEALKMMKSFKTAMGENIFLSALFRNSGHKHRFDSFEDVLYAFYDKKDYADYYLKNREFWAKMLDHYDLH